MPIAISLLLKISIIALRAPRLCAYSFVGPPGIAGTANFSASPAKIAANVNLFTMDSA
jgi:hypothetical protein